MGGDKDTEMEAMGYSMGGQHTEKGSDEETKVGGDGVPGMISDRSSEIE